MQSTNYAWMLAVSSWC